MLNLLLSLPTLIAGFFQVPKQALHSILSKRLNPTVEQKEMNTFNPFTPKCDQLSGIPHPEGELTGDPEQLMTAETTCVTVAVSLLY